MTNSPKKHIIDSLLREIYGEKSPPDQTDAILRRLESGDSTLLTETKSDSYSADSGPYPTIRPETVSGQSPTINWIVIAATVVFCVGLIGAMARVLLPTGKNDLVAESQTDSDEKSDSALKRSKSLAVKQPVDNSSNPNSTTTNSSAELVENKPNQTQTNDATHGDSLKDVKPFSNNPLPTFAQNAKRIDLLDVKSRIDRSLSENWHVHVIENPKSIAEKEWVERVFLKTLGRKPESAELAKVANYLGGDELPSPENQLRIVESIMTDESTSREFAHHWADLFLTHASNQSTDQRRSLSPEKSALKSFLRQSFVSRKPLDEIVAGLITANGSIDPQAIEFNGAAGFVALAGNDPNTLAENISRSFLGTELTCARCHSDMVHEQSRTDYLGLTAFLQGTNVTRKQTGVSVVNEVATTRKVPGLFYSNRSGLGVYAAPLIAGHDAELNQKDGRGSLAAQLVRSDRFAKAMVNWVWSEIYGYGLARNGRINQTVSAPHQLLMAELSEQLVANDFDFRAIVKWAILSRSFGAQAEPSSDTLTKDIPKYGGVAFFSYLYKQLEHDPSQSLSRLTKAYQDPKGLTESARISLNVKPVGKGIEIIDQMENGVLPNGLKIDDEVPEFARGWGVESARVVALDRIADSKTLKLQQKIEHLFRLAIHRKPSQAEAKHSRSLFNVGRSNGQAENPRSEREVLQDLWWAICPR